MSPAEDPEGYDVIELPDGKLTKARHSFSVNMIFQTKHISLELFLEPTMWYFVVTFQYHSVSHIFLRPFWATGHWF